VDFSVYSRQRIFQEPFFKTTEVVGLQSMIWAFLFGPVFFWKKRARAEALLFVLAIAPSLSIDHSGSRYGVTLSGVEFLSPLMWTAFAAFAPVLLAAAYRRKRWIEGGPPN